jgi:DNA invertase Pin-like site-specific DNA recombinase
MQLRELREYVARRGWESVGEYVDTGFSGAKASRPELDRLVRDARRRRFDGVVVWKLDRWGRSLAHLVQSVQELSSLGIRFVAMTQNIDTDESNPMARLLMHLMAAFAEFEAEMIRERVKAGVKNAQAKGKRVGRPRRVFRRDEAIEMRAAGMSWRRIADLLQVPLATLVDRCSENPYADLGQKQGKQRRVATS